MKGSAPLVVVVCAVAVLGGGAVASLPGPRARRAVGTREVLVLGVTGLGRGAVQGLG